MAVSNCVGHDGTTDAVLKRVEVEFRCGTYWCDIGTQCWVHRFNVEGAHFGARVLKRLQRSNAFPKPLRSGLPSLATADSDHVRKAPDCLPSRVVNLAVRISAEVSVQIVLSSGERRQSGSVLRLVFRSSSAVVREGSPELCRRNQTQQWRMWQSRSLS